MDGRFADHLNLKQLKAIFPIDQISCEVTTNTSAAPSDEIFAIINDKGVNRLDKFHWGLVPFWARDISIGKRMINARAESIAEKPAFREAFLYRRCLIPADGFYEWTGKTDQRQPVFIALPDRRPFAFAGLWETWKNTNDESAIYLSCAIITTSASDSFRAVHHRMPAILKPAVFQVWLDPETQNAAMLGEVIKSEIITELASFTVPKRANATLPEDSAADEAVDKPRQTMFDWPEFNRSSTGNE
jgi:putative SOS response-associated peptidase YedK